jgi:hypothetical protein
MYDNYFTNFENFWHSKKGKIEKKLNKLDMQDANDPKNIKYASTIKFYQDITLDKDTPMNIDNDIGENDSIFPNNPLGQSRSSMKTLFAYSNGKFETGGSIDREQAQQAFRWNVKSMVNTYKTKKRGMTILVKKML